MVIKLAFMNNMSNEFIEYQIAGFKLAKKIIKNA